MSMNKTVENSHKPTLSYTLFLHQSQLRIRKKRLVGQVLPLIQSKLLVTDSLISQTKVLSDWNYEDLMHEKIYSNRLKLALFRVLSQNNSILMQKKKKDFKLAVTRGRKDDDEVNNIKRQKLTNNQAMREITDIKKKFQMNADKSFEKSHKPTLGYTLFMHQLQLRTPKKRPFGPCLPIIKSKLLVTDTLISQIKVQSDMDYEALKQEQIFSDFLKLCMVRILNNSRKEKQFKVAVIRRREDDNEENTPKRQRLTNNEAAIESTDFKNRKSSHSA
uniref:Uncharacterized protein n=1 Tax=Bactrocera latifrons TaxID=174628 RepID=A0A0K8WDN2_BACLA